MRTPEPKTAGSARLYLPDAILDVPRPGDFLLSRGDHRMSRLIRFGQGLRIHGADRMHTCWTHAALIVDPDGSIIHTTGVGVTTGNVADYQYRYRALVDIGASGADRDQVVGFARHALANHSGYNWVAFASTGLTLLTGSTFCFSMSGQYTCSGFVAEALQRTSAIFDRDAGHITPADLAKYYRVPAPLRRGPTAAVPAERSPSRSGV